MGYARNPIPWFAIGEVFCYNYCIMQNNANAHPKDFREVYRTFNPADIAFIKSILEENDVVYYINNENVPFVGGLAFAEPMRVMVEADKFEAVQELLKDFQGNFGAFSFEDEPPPGDEESGSNND